MAFRGSALVGSGIIAGLLIAGAGGFALARPAVQDGELCTDNPAIALPLCGGGGTSPQPQPGQQPEMPGAPPMAPGASNGPPQQPPAPPVAPPQPAAPVAPQQPAAPQQPSATSYVSPLGIYAVSWQMPWAYVQEASVPDQGAIALTNGVSDVYFEESRTTFQSPEQFANAIDTSGWMIVSADGSQEQYVLGMVNGDNLARIVSFRQVGPSGATTDFSVISWLVGAQFASEQAPAIEGLLGNVTFGAYGSASPDGSNARVGWANASVAAAIGALVGTESWTAAGAVPATDLAASARVVLRQQGAGLSGLNDEIIQVIQRLSRHGETASLINTAPLPTGSPPRSCPPKCRVAPKAGTAPASASLSGSQAFPTRGIDSAVAAMMGNGALTSVLSNSDDAGISKLQSSQEFDGPTVRSERYGFELQWAGWDLPMVQDSAYGFDAVLVRGQSLVHVMGMEETSGATAADIGAWRLRQAGVAFEQTAVLRNGQGAFSARFTTPTDSGLVSVMQGVNSPGTWQVIFWAAPNDRFAADWPAVSSLLSSISVSA